MGAARQKYAEEIRKQKEQYTKSISSNSYSETLKNKNSNINKNETLSININKYKYKSQTLNATFNQTKQKRIIPEQKHMWKAQIR